MRFDAVIQLIAVTYTKDAIGQEIPVETPREVLANAFDVSHAEFSAAGAAGLKADCLYQVRSCEYAGERLMAVGDARYTIIRVKARGEWTLLTGEEDLGNG